jgi:hypothetical protein
MKYENYGDGSHPTRDYQLEKLKEFIGLRKSSTPGLMKRFVKIMGKI